MPLQDEVQNYYGSGVADLSESHDLRALKHSDDIHYLNRINNALQTSVTDITSRDQIINPDSLLDSSYYRNTKKGQALYNEHRNALVAIQQQEASYNEWYESPEQVALREKAAGRNPNLIDGALGSHESSEVSPQSQSPIHGIPTTGETVLGFAQTFTQIIGNIASLAALPASIGAANASAMASKSAAGLTAAQTEAQLLANNRLLENDYFTHISGLLSDATNLALKNKDNSFDPVAWLNDSKNLDGVIELFGDPNNDRHRAAFNRAKSSVIKLRQSANKDLGDSVNTQTWLSEALANPYRDDDLLIQMMTTIPVMEAIEDLRLQRQDYETWLARFNSIKTQNLDAVSAASAQNAEWKFNHDYWSNLSGDEKAAADLLSLKSQAVIDNCRSLVYDNYYQTFKDNPTSFLGQRCSAIIMGSTPMDIETYLGQYASEVINAEPPKSFRKRAGEFFDRVGEKLFQPHRYDPTHDQAVYTKDYVDSQLQFWNDVYERNEKNGWEYKTEGGL